MSDDIEWRLHRPGKAERDRIVALRGGPGKDFPCNNACMIECALWECQKERRCRYTITDGQTEDRK